MFERLASQLMIRGILLFIVIIIAIPLILPLIRSLFKLLDFAAPNTPQPPPVPLSGELKRDPVCGTFVSSGTQFKKTVHGQAVYFCSADCRDRYSG